MSKRKLNTTTSQPTLEAVLSAQQQNGSNSTPKKASRTHNFETEEARSPNTKWVKEQLTFVGEGNERKVKCTHCCNDKGLFSRTTSSTHLISHMQTVHKMVPPKATNIVLKLFAQTHKHTTHNSQFQCDIIDNAQSIA